MVDNRVYVVVTQEHGVVVKRCLNRIKKYGGIFCKSDNRREYPSYSVAAGEIKEVWEVKLAMFYNFTRPNRSIRFRGKNVPTRGPSIRENTTQKALI